MRFLVLLALLASIVTAVPAHAYAPEQTPARQTEAHARHLATARAGGTPIPGIVVLRGAARLVSINGSRPFVPASLTKLVTTTVAMQKLSPTRRFHTRAFASDRGARVGTLTLVGGGDPTFSTEAYRRGRFLPKPKDAIKRPAFATRSPTVEQLAEQIRRAGVRTVTGDLLVDESLFDSVRTPPGWLRSYTAIEPDSGYLSALSLNEGRGDVDGKTLIADNAFAAGRALKSALAKRGVRVSGGVRRGKRPSGAPLVGDVLSPPVSEIIEFLNRYSVNFHAEILVKHLGKRFGKTGSSREGTRILKETLRDLDLNVKTLTLTDGSGLSVQNRMTPRFVADLLMVITTRKGAAWDALRGSVPVAGQAGTLQRRMRGTAAANNLRGKTGQLRGVRAMAGWVTGRDGVPIVYAAMFNAAPQPFALTSPIDRFGIALARSPRS